MLYTIKLKFLTIVTDYVSSFGTNADYDEVLRMSSDKLKIPVKTLASILTAYRGRNYFK